MKEKSNNFITYEDKHIKMIQYKYSDVTLLELKRKSHPKCREEILYGFWHGGESQGRMIEGKPENPKPKNSKLYVYYDQELTKFKKEASNLRDAFSLR